MVVCEGVEKWFDDFPALRGVDLTVGRQEVVVIIGPSGSGKSTLLRTLNGLVPHFSGGSFAGRVEVYGRDTLTHPPRRLADVVGFVPQDPGSSFVLDEVESEIAYALENLGLGRSAMRRRVEEALDLLDLAGLRRRSLRTLSGGERQRVAIAAALSARPRLLVLDEPTSQLDPQAAEDVLAALKRLVDDLGLTVVVAEHRLERVAGFADLALGCLGERQVVEGAPAEVMALAGTGPPVARLGRVLGWDPVPLTVRAARSFADGVAARLGTPPRQVVSAGEMLARAEGLEARYGTVVALRGVDLELHRGEVVALIGRNGAGKTTLLRALCGLHPPVAGWIEVGGAPPIPGVSAALCPQDPDDALFCDTVEHEIEATLRARGLGRDARPLLEAFSLQGLAQRHPRDLSAGQRLLVACAAIAATGAPLLLLDEPTRGLDPETKAALTRSMHAHARAGGAVVFATHDVELAAGAATRVVMLASGEVIADGEPGAVLGDSPVFSPQVARVLGGGWLTPEQVIAAVTT
jgi:energy-coupling factor transport system ATP-binding protein